MSTKTICEVEYLRTGQVRAYGPTEVEAILSLGFINYFGEYFPATTDDYARKVAKTLVGWTEDGEGDWHSVRLVDFGKVEDGKWRVVTRQAYDD